MMKFFIKGSLQKTISMIDFYDFFSVGPRGAVWPPRWGHAIKLPQILCIKLSFTFFLDSTFRFFFCILCHYGKAKMITTRCSM